MLAFKISTCWTFEIYSILEVLKFFRRTSFSLPGLSMLAKSVAPQKTSVPQAGSSLAFLSPFVPFVPGTKPDRVDTHLFFMRDI